MCLACASVDANVAAVHAAAVPSMPLWTPKGNVSMPVIGEIIFADFFFEEICLSGLGTAFGSDAAGLNTTYFAVRSWLQNGGRAIHGAWMYCNQKAVGRAIKDSGVPRKEIFIMSMVPQWELGYNSTKTSFRSTLAELGVDFVDLYMFHWPGMF